MQEFKALVILATLVIAFLKAERDTEMRKSLSSYREVLLRDGATYNISLVQILNSLPILDARNKNEFPEWHTYIQRIYGASVSLPIDLNKLTWFYWASPLRLEHIYLCDWVENSPQVPYGTPWIGGIAAWKSGPEHLVRRGGFFVHRQPWRTQDYLQAARLEVMRVGPLDMVSPRTFKEESQVWLYHAIGSGIFVRTGVFSRLEVRYELHTSVPRIELVGTLPKLSRGVDFWHEDVLRFELLDEQACTSTAPKYRILSCASMKLPLWKGDDDPLPQACPNAGVVPGRSFGFVSPEVVSRCENSSLQLSSQGVAMRG